MKRITTTFVLMLLLTRYAGAQQQIANSGFESWDTIGDYTQPSNWYTLNPLAAFGFDPSTTITNDAHSGNYAVQLESLSGQFTDISGVLCTGPILNENLQPDFSKMKVAFASKPVALQFYYKAFPQQGDTGVLAMYLTRWNTALQKTDTVAQASMSFADSVSVYTLANCVFNYYSPLQPDSMFIIGSSSIDGFNPTIGSKLLLDDFLLTYPTTGLNDMYLPSLSIYPNPVQHELRIQSDEEIKGVMKLYSVTGKLIAEKVVNGKNTIVDVSTLGDGIYFVILQSEQGQLVSCKIKVQH